MHNVNASHKYGHANDVTIQTIITLKFTATIYYCVMPKGQQQPTQKLTEN